MQVCLVQPYHIERLEEKNKLIFTWHRYIVFTDVMTRLVTVVDVPHPLPSLMGVHKCWLISKTYFQSTVFIWLVIKHYCWSFVEILWLYGTYTRNGKHCERKYVEFYPIQCVMHRTLSSGILNASLCSVTIPNIEPLERKCKIENLSSPGVGTMYSQM